MLDSTGNIILEKEIETSNPDQGIGVIADQPGFIYVTGTVRGSDFPGDDMEIVVVVGIPYPPITLENTMRMEYYDKFTKATCYITNEDPAFKQINQVAGRAIRSLKDTGIIYLLDERIEKKINSLRGWMREPVEVKDYLKFE